MNLAVDLSRIGFDIGEIISAFIGIIGVLIGAWVAKSGAAKMQRIDSMRQAYSQVFQKYMEWIPVQDVNHSAALCGAICSAMLVAKSNETFASLQNMLSVFSGQKRDSEICKKAIEEFWDCAQKELRK